MSPLISVSELIGKPVRFLDARFKLGDPEFGHNAYRAGHIPGAAFVDLEKDLSAPVRPDRKGGRHPMPAPDVLAALFSRLGIRNSDFIVAYDDPSTGQGFYAAHLWWLLRYLGHDQVAVLDGGLPAWVANHGALETTEPHYEPSSFQVHPRLSMIVDATAVANRSDGTVLIDSRAPERFRGDVEPLDWKAGHIPGAVNRNWADGLDKQGFWRPGPQQAVRFADVISQQEVIVYCGSGVSAGGNLLAIELAGIQGAKLYAGSWSDWVSDDSRAVAKGEL